MDWKQVVSGAVSGFLAAFVVDLQAWSRVRSEESFSWSLAAKRWVAGAVSGATAGFGMGQIPM